MHYILIYMWLVNGGVTYSSASSEQTWAMQTQEFASFQACEKVRDLVPKNPRLYRAYCVPKE